MIWILLSTLMVGMLVQAQGPCDVIVEEADFSADLLCTGREIAPCVILRYRNQSAKVLKGIKFEAEYSDATGDYHPLQVFTLAGTRISPQFTPDTLSQSRILKPNQKTFLVKTINIPGIMDRKGLVSVSSSSTVKAWPVKALFEDGSIWQPGDGGRQCFIPPPARVKK